MSNAFFYWTAVPAEREDWPSALREWIRSLPGGKVERERYWTRSDATRVGESVENYWVLFSSSEDIHADLKAPRSEVGPWDVRDGAASTEFEMLGKIPEQIAEKTRALIYTNPPPHIITDDEQAHAYVSDGKNELFEEIKARDKQRQQNVIIFAAVGAGLSLGLLTLILKKKRRRGYR